MKTISLKIAALGLALGFGVVMTPSVNAVPVDTSKGSRLAVAQPLRTVEDFKNLRQGDKIAAYCPMMKETYITTVRNVDSKGHATITETKKGLAVGGCNIILKKNAGSKEVSTLMVCPSGKVLPVNCSKM